MKHMIPPLSVIPAKAGIHAGSSCLACEEAVTWTPTFVGVTGEAAHA
jgi:hypothetical protein